MCNDQLNSIINNNNNIVFFGGAGVSTESSIPDFRSESGLYTTKNNFSYPPEVMLSASFFSEHPEDFFEFYREKLIYKDAKPNLAIFTDFLYNSGVKTFLASFNPVIDAQASLIRIGISGMNASLPTLFLTKFVNLFNLFLFPSLDSFLNGTNTPK